MAAVIARIQPWLNQPTRPAGIDWSHRRTRDLVFFAPLSGQHGAVDLVSGQFPTKTGLHDFSGADGASYHLFGTSNYADYATVPVGIGATTPFTVAWTQYAKATAAGSTILNINFGTPGTHNSFLVYGSSTDATYYCTAGLRAASGAASWSVAAGAITNERLDRFCLLVPNGSQNMASAALYRNGVLLSRGTNANFGAATAAIFRVGAIETGTDPFEGCLGDLRMWSRALADEEAEIESTFAGSHQLYKPQRIFFSKAAASTAFQSAWARNANSLIQTTVA